MNTDRIKAVIDLHDYLNTLGNDRPPLGVFLKDLGIDPKIMSDCVTATAHAAHIAIPEAAIKCCNHLFKLGVTIGYKYTVKKEMERQFPVDDVAPEENDNG
jgi:hypothetical protein